jgi:hypothetical protein
VQEGYFSIKTNLIQLNKILKILFSFSGRTLLSMLQPTAT